MFELIYPDGPVPEIPHPVAMSAAERAGQEPRAASDTSLSEAADGIGRPRREYFPVIAPNGVVLGRATRVYCHSGAKPLHPVVHLHIIDRYGRLYLQKRSMSKDIQPGRWDTAVGGHIDFGESVIEALYRESSEELGLTAYNPVWLCSYEFESEIEKEMINVFAAVGSFSLSPDHEEVDEVRGWTMDEIGENLGKSLFTPNFEGEFVRIKDSLLALL